MVYNNWLLVWFNASQKNSVNSSNSSCIICTYVYHIAGKFRWVKFSLAGLESLFCDLIFVVCPKHVITVADCQRLLFECPDSRGLIFHVGALRNENKTQRKFPGKTLLLRVLRITICTCTLKTEKPILYDGIKLFKGTDKLTRLIYLKILTIKENKSTTKYLFLGKTESSFACRR